MAGATKRATVKSVENILVAVRVSGVIKERDTGGTRERGEA